MEEGMVLILAVVGIVGAVIGGMIGKSLADDEQTRKMVRKEWELKQSQEKHEREIKVFHEHREKEFSTLVAQAREFYDELQKGMLRGQQWLADAFAEFVDTRNFDTECWLAVKPHPAAKASDQVATIRRRFREAGQKMKLLEYQVASYEEYFPFLLEYRNAILDESVDLRTDALETLDKADPALSQGYLSSTEYDKLSTIEKFQLALDRYWGRQKNQWEIGRVYERYLGYLYENDGWQVTYQGILMGFEDFGRDLICRRGNDIHIVQCKCWSRQKVIHEKHVFQLFGTTVLFRLSGDGNESNRQQVLFPVTEADVTPVFATTTDLSEDALAVARHLDISIRTEPLCRYPMVKCNINPKTQERIYHLPFDQQYDKVIIGNIEGEFYADTVAEAEEAGFRRAFRWRGNMKDHEK